MKLIDWIILFTTLALIVVYGTWKSRGSKDIDGYLLGNKSLPWWNVCLSIMATQASAITFLSTPGQAYEDGMRFLQFYFGLPLAMVILSITAVPLYHRLKVYTAYEYLETRFDRKTRTLAAFYFLMLRGLSVGITIYAPALILSTMLDWNINLTTIFIGTLVMIYTVSGGTKAVSMTQKYQLTIIMTGMIIAGLTALYKLPNNITFTETFQLAGEMGKMNLINLSFDLSDRYNIWSGLIGGLFLFLSYFGADQSQVGRYLGGKSITETRLGLLFNGLLKVPMQFVILYIGILVFVFYQFNQAPVFHNQSLIHKAKQTEYADKITSLESDYNKVFLDRKQEAENLIGAIRREDAKQIEESKKSIEKIQASEKSIRSQVKGQIAAALEIPVANTRDTDYVFITFVMRYLPHGLIGLLLAVVFSAAMSSSASELNALASTTTVDIYRRSIKPKANDYHYVSASKWFTAGWAVFGMLFASIANQAENLIQFVNIVGSIFYGTILGIFLSAFYLKYLKSNAIFIAGIVAEAVIVYCYFFTEIAFLLYNIIGCLVVVVLGFALQYLENQFIKKASR
ncbi:MAG: sodium:solute symporter [Cyclobacteriaceae bacterium]|jgi:SSS family solute:Na+ symporter|nr:sodium:solute symporter [Cyclobacteriaceae bacterium]